MANQGKALLEAAEAGRSLITSLTKFTSYRKAQDSLFDNLYATVSITTNILNELGTTLNKHEDFYIREEMIKPISETCKANFQKLSTFFSEGLAGGVYQNDGTIGGQPVTTEVDPWFLIITSLGGIRESDALWDSLYDTRAAILHLKDTINYQILKDLNEKKVITPEEAEEFKGLQAILPHLVQRLENEQIAKKAAEERANANYMPPQMHRMNSDHYSDATLTLEQRAPAQRRGRRMSVKEPDRRSISSFSTRSDSGTQATEKYEEWILRWYVPVKLSKKTWSFLGLKLESYFDDKGFWDTDAQLRTQAELKEQEAIATAGLTPEQHRAAMQKAIRAIPKKGGHAIDFLLWDRTQSSSHEYAKREWTVISVRPKPMFAYSTKKWGKDPLHTEWLVTIKGTTIDTKPRTRCHRLDDPWTVRYANYGGAQYFRKLRQSYPPPPPGPGPHPIRNARDAGFFDDRRDRSPSPERRVTVDRTPNDQRFVVRSEPNPEIKVGRVTLGRIPSKEEAERKMEVIWKEMMGEGDQNVRGVSEEEKGN